MLVDLQQKPFDQSQRFECHIIKVNQLVILERKSQIDIFWLETIKDAMNHQTLINASFCLQLFSGLE